MNMNHLRAMDLNLLVILECLFRHQNVTSAAQELRITQSALSHALNRLRAHYKDPLFVRVPKGVTATEFAKSLRSEVESFVTRALALVEKVETFDPLKVEGRFVIATTDYFEVVAGPQIFRRVSQEAPGLQLSFRPTLGVTPTKQLEEGAYDLAIAGFYKNLPEGFYQQKLFEDSFLVSYSKNHPKIVKPLNAENFYDHDHALITLQGDFNDRLSKTVKGKRKTRKIKWGTASFTSMGWMLSQTDLVLTAPSLLIKSYEKYFPVVVQKVPFEMEPIAVQMVWHGVTNHNPLNRWMRQLIKDISKGFN